MPMHNAAEITVEDYQRAFLALYGEDKVSDNQVTMLRHHARHKITTARDLAELVGYNGHRGANLQYGTLAKRVANKVGYQPPKGYTFLSTIVTFSQESTPYPMELRPNVIEALKQIGWV
jgi:hypothetical protein